jgi:hypothetical protein
VAQVSTPSVDRVVGGEVDQVLPLRAALTEDVLGGQREAGEVDRSQEGGSVEKVMKSFAPGPIFLLTMLSTRIELLPLSGKDGVQPRPFR